MPFPVSSSVDVQSDSEICTTPRWGAWSACLIVGCFYLTQAVGLMTVDFITSQSLSVVDGSTGESPEMVARQSPSWLFPFSLLIGTITGAVVAVHVATRRAQATLDSDWFWMFVSKFDDFRGLWRFLLGGLALGIGFVVLTEYGVLPADDLPQPLVDTLVAAPFLLQIFWVLMIVVFFPTVEEVLFRGFLFTGFSQSWGPSLAGLLSTVAFVAVHMPKVLEYWPALMAVTIIGTLTVFIRIRTDSLLPGIVLHTTYNGVLITSALLMQTEPS